MLLLAFLTFLVFILSALGVKGVNFSVSLTGFSFEKFSELVVVIDLLALGFRYVQSLFSDFSTCRFFLLLSSQEGSNSRQLPTM